MSTDFDKMIKTLDDYFRGLSIDYLIVGAKARDLIAKKANLPRPRRRTSDVDLGVMIENWNSFKSLTQSFKDDLRIKYTPTPLNKLRYTCEAIPFDLVPFGGIEKSGEVSIPPSYDSLMNVTGYDDALRCAITYSVDDKKIKIASPEMLVSLKLVAWDENPARDRDASDIFYLMKNYEHIDPDAYTYILDNYGEVLEYFNHETTLSHVALLGIRLSNYINYANVDMINKILRDENKKERFIRGMQPEKTELEHEYEYIKAFLYGLNYE